MARDNEHIEINGYEVRQTEAAILWMLDDADDPMWFPLSQVEVSTDGGSLLVPRWLAAKKGIG